jgi:hypothetical protein
MAHPTLRSIVFRLLAVTALVLGATWGNARARSVVTPALAPKIAKTDGELNIIRIRFDTIKLKPHQNFLLMPVKWSYSLPKPHDFRAFNVHFAVDPAKVTISDFYIQGTASEAMNGTPFTNTADTDARFVILGTNEPNFSNPVLFNVAVSVRLNPGEVTPFHWTFVEDPTYFKIDTIITEDGWIALEPPRTAAVSSPDTTMKADTVISIPVSITDLSGTGVTQARITATLDTSVFDLVGATPGAHQNAQVVAGLTGTTLTLDVSAKSSGTLSGNDVLVNLQLRAKARPDTVCKALTNASFQALNSDAYIGSVSVWFGIVCVFGKPPASAVTGTQAPMLEVYPNPVGGVLHLGQPGEEPVVSVHVYDVLGHEVFRGTDVTEWRPAAELPNGVYHIRAITREGSEREVNVTLQR